MLRVWRKLVVLCSVSFTVVLGAPNESRIAADAQISAGRVFAGVESRPLDDILSYISSDWTRLTRSLSDCSTYRDEKTNGGSTLYFPVGVQVPPGLMESLNRCSVRTAFLPEKLFDSNGKLTYQVQGHGLLYLENPYVVPGGQFNEMYGWDSYFIIRGLILSGQWTLAKGMVENFFYEIEHYGGVLNANRTYYLGRSQPPFLTSMIFAVYQADQAPQDKKLEWVAKAYSYAVRDYEQWTKAPHLAGDTGLSRYFDEGEGPVPEILGSSENYYHGVAQYFLMHEGVNSPHLTQIGAGQTPDAMIGPVFQIPDCEPNQSAPRAKNCQEIDRVALTAEDYKGDRSMRESGFDVSFRFGPYGVDTHHYAPVCLNSLLYKTEKDLEEMSRLLGRADDAQHWHEQADARRNRITKYLWNSGSGLYFDYDFKDHAQSSYVYATAFYPLWTGLATEEQARAVEKNLALFEHPGGLAMSRHESQAQWDYPYGWAPVHLLAVEGLRRYRFEGDADRITFKFLSMVLRNFRREHTMREKYDVVSGTTATHIGIGYVQNANGFGWTNGVFLALLKEAPKEMVSHLEK